MRSSLYSLSAGSEHPANCQDPHKAFARGPMTPTVVGVGILQVLACGEGGIPIRPAPSCERIGGPMPTQSKTASSTSQDFPKAQSRSSGLFRRDLQPQNGHFSQRYDLLLPYRDNRKKRSVGCAESGQQKAYHFFDFSFEDFGDRQRVFAGQTQLCQ